MQDDKQDDNIIQLLQAIRQSGKKKFVLQLPEGLKTRAAEIIAAMEKEGFEIIYAADPSYGACDLATEQAKICGADAIVHVGHSKFYVDIQSDTDVIYFPWKIEIDFGAIDISPVKEETIGLVTSIQHREAIEKAKSFLEEKGKKAVIGGQILGCWSLAAKSIEDKVDAFLFIGSGSFHPLALKDCSRPVYSMNIEMQRVEKIDISAWEKRRWADIYRARDAKTIGILVSTKPGQKELLGVASEIKKKLEQSQRRAFVLILNEITEAKLQGIKADAFINTACPRITDETFSRPVINATDIDNVLEE
jgi:2-(3-amino-3-carboxypropyl)histidine synthase